MDDMHTTRTTHRGFKTTPPSVVRDRAGLISALRRVDAEGWEGPTGTALLHYLRAELVRPLAIRAGLRGAAASQAEATAWEAVWEAMTKPSLREAQSPWGVLWQVARRSVLGEIVAAQYGTNERRGRSLAAAARQGGAHPATSLDAVLAEGREPASATADPAVGVLWQEVLHHACTALVDVGWESGTAARIVDAVLWMPTTPDPRCTIVGWRLLACDLDVPPWQARRLALALRGTSSAPGLMPLLATIGEPALRDPALREALRATRRRT
ncbi:hypothetical protein [Cellulomonas carbonis]|uniref:Uncharacterized protein n=1 Tax=Cellulomonas carbonis T26 TaxID=947969 RepID=A0A0A0BU08_9CELL|nr:hypothetical protein [Cellulomonas carbonis]KGM11888.1 hypothetical protein N868_04885 [Cellulomonas carbonis T26]GGB91568.1 hypothetical protein GCM10010972_00250 [Cellulomonas carbonis]